MNPTDSRLSAFLSDRTEVFHSIQHRHEVWRQDPFDVETVHQEARTAFERLLSRATTPPGLDSGRMLLLLGDSGCGKTHLMRAFRALVHERSLGFVGYLQMTTATSNYGRYVLSNLIESLDQPYFAPAQPRTGLEKLSDALLACCGMVAALLPDPETDPDEVHRLVDFAADDLREQPRFARVDLDLLRALLFLQRDEPRIKGRVLRYLRCEDLSEADRKVLGGLVPRVHDHHPQEMLEQLGRLVAALGQSLVLCVDQLEGFNDFEDVSGPPFRRAMTALCDFADRVPSSLVVISCLHNFWAGLSNQLTQPIRDRILQDPAPVRLEALRTADEARRIAERRLEHLYELEEAPFDPAEPTWPFPHEGFEELSGLRARDVLNVCRLWREQAIRDGQLPERFPLVDPQDTAPQPPSNEKQPQTLALEQAWNDFRAANRTSPPEDDAGLAELLTWALRASMDELDTGHRLEVRAVDGALQVDLSPGEERLRVTLCNRGTQGGGLARQLEQVRKEARGRTPVVVRRSAFPSNPKTSAAEELGKLIAKGGRRAVLEDSDCRILLALKAFRQQHESRPDFSAWLRSAQPLTQLKPLRDMLDLDHLRAQAKAAPSAQAATPTRPEPTRTPPPPPAIPEDRPVPRRPAEQQSLVPAWATPTSRPPVERFASAKVDVTPPRAPAAASARPAATSSVPPPLPSRARTAPEAPTVPQAPTASEAAAPQRGPVRLGELDGLLREPVLMKPEELTQHAAFLGGSGSGKTTAALNVVEQLLLQGVPVVLVDRKGDLAGYATEAFWTQPLEDARRAERRALLHERVDVALFTPGHPNGRPLAIPVVPDGLGELQDFDRQLATRHAADALSGMLDYRQSPRDKSCRTLLAQAIDQLVQLTRQPVTLEALVGFIGDKDPRLVSAAGRLDTKLFDKLADDLDRLRIDAKLLLEGSAERLDMDLLLGRGAHARPGRTRLSVVSTKFLGDNANVLFWVSQLLIEATRWMGRSPSGTLQAVLLFDEADLYLPATRQPATKQPMENLLKRARSAGLGLMLATQSPGDFDYKCRDNIRSWFIGRVKEPVAMEKMKPMLNEARGPDFSAKIPHQATGEFHVVREGRVQRLKADASALRTEQLPDDELLRLAASTLPSAQTPTGS